jgi:fructoselysine-6-P-deglycase FrlB-like protein
MPTALLRMIGQQAEAMDRMAGLDLAGPAAVLAAAARVVLTGTGTSQHAAELGAMMLAGAGLDTRWYPAASWARWDSGPRPGDALVVISHTGETAYAARARAAYAVSPVWLITTSASPGRGPLSQRAQLAAGYQRVSRPAPASIIAPSSAACWLVPVPVSTTRAAAASTAAGPARSSPAIRSIASACWPIMRSSAVGMRSPLSTR